MSIVNGKPLAAIGKFMIGEKLVTNGKGITNAIIGKLVI